MKATISAIVLSCDEALNIEACLQSLSGWVDEVFVVDSGSTDGTRELAASCGATVVTHPFEGYSKQRNWAQRELPLSGSWILHVDADERFEPILAAWIRSFVDDPALSEDVSGVLMKRKVRFLGADIRHGGIYPTYHCRLFRAGMGRCEDREYDQHFVVWGRTVRADGNIVEDNGYDVVRWCQKHLRWADLEAREIVRRSRCKGRNRESVSSTIPRRLRGRALGNLMERRRWLRDTVYGRAPRGLRAWIYFGYRIVIRLGFLDGWRGFIYHFLHGLWFRTVVDVIALSKEREWNSPPHRAPPGL